MTTNKTIGLIGTGIFLYLTLLGISHLVATILRDTLLFTKLNPLLINAISEYATMIVVLIVFIFTIKKIKTIDFEQPKMIRKIFLTSVSAYLLTQVIGFIKPFVYKLNQTTEYYELFAEYLDGLAAQSLLNNLTIDTPAWLLKYALMAFIILKEINRNNLNIKTTS